MSFEIVEMTETYYEGKAYVHFAAWLETYRGLVPDRYLKRRTLEDCRKFTTENPQNTYVALVNGKVSGFLWYSPTARAFTKRSKTSEICALYVLKDYQGLGIGKALMEACLKVLPCETTILYVLKGNQKAAAFYEHMGFRFTGKTMRMDTGDGVLEELEMIWGRGM